ncbi:MAG: hypothetical protein CR993_04100 [Rhodobacterales bacterium]|nr:MAG: hypothetical protein CR993_04100 [Rhodobacterales bacterium]
MTALKEFDRLEAAGLWRAQDGAQRQNVVVSLGDATLTICDMADRPLTAWSLPAVVRLNPGERPAVFAPSDAAGEAESLEIEDEIMVDAVEKLRRAIERRRPHRGRLRLWLTGAVLVGALGLGVFWLPGALQRYTLSVLPDVTRAEIGAQLLDRLRRVTGQPCEDPAGQRALAALHARVLPEVSGRAVILSAGIAQAAHLPGGIVLLNRAVLEDFEEPDVAAGFLLAEDARAQARDPVAQLLEFTGISGTFRLLTTGHLPGATLDSYTETLLTAAPVPLSDAALLARFKAAGIRSTPYAYALDMTGETTLGLIEADPVPLARAEPLLPDADWVRLQGICGE